MRLNAKGFSLVELMVVIGIIGILAAVAVPQFSKFQAKARQSEAKSSLAALYTSEKGFHAEYEGYATAFQALGYAPVGEVLYNIGFNALCASWAVCAPNYAPGGVAPVPVGDPARTDTTCAAWTAPMTTVGCRMRAISASNSIGYVAITTGDASRIAFSAEAAARIYSGYSTPDRWTINERKILVHTSEGLP